MGLAQPLLRVEVPGEGYHRQPDLLSGRVSRAHRRARLRARHRRRAASRRPISSRAGRIRSPRSAGASAARRARRRAAAAASRGSTTTAASSAPDRPIAIRALKRFACERAGVEARPAERRARRGARPTCREVCADAEEMAALLRALVRRAASRRRTGERVAIIGAGPAGLSGRARSGADGLLARWSSRASRSPPGMLAVGVPEYRLPRELIRREVAVIEALGVEIRCGVTVGRGRLASPSCAATHAAVIIAVGAKRSRAPRPAGRARARASTAASICCARWRSASRSTSGSDVVVDRRRQRRLRRRAHACCARSPTTRRARRRGCPARAASASCRSRRSRRCRPTRSRFVEGDEEGIERLNGWGPVEIERDACGRVTGVRFRRCLRVYDDAPALRARLRRRRSAARSPATPCCSPSGRRRTSRSSTTAAPTSSELRPGWPKVDPRTLATTAPGVFVAGDLAHGTRLLIDAVASGKKAARSVYRYVTGREHRDRRRSTAHLAARRATAASAATRRFAASRSRRSRADERLRRSGARRSRSATTRARRVREASRCLDCGVTPVFDGTRCVLCGGCVDVCPTLVPEARAARRPRADAPTCDAPIDAALGPGRRPRRELRDPQGRRPLHPLRAVRHALPGRTPSRWSACSSRTTWRTA